MATTMIHLDGSVIEAIISGEWNLQEPAAMSAIAYSEAIRGAVLSPTSGFLIDKASFVRKIPLDRIISFDRDIAEIFADLSPGRTGGQQARDLMIAATAIARGARLATNDRRLAALHGASVPGRAPLDILHIE